MAIKVLIVDDSATAREILKTALSKDKNIEIIGMAPDAFVARDMIVNLRPDVICLDIEMPKMDGLTFLKKIMRHLPTPVIMVSSLTVKGAQTTLDALSFGAFDYIAKNTTSLDKLDVFADEIIKKVKQASRVNPTILQMRLQNTLKKSSTQTVSLKKESNKIVLIGSSTGGTVALEDFLKRLPSDFPPIVIVQHMPASFTNGFAQRLNNLCKMEVQEARDGDMLQKGKVLIANGSYHLKLRRSGNRYFVNFDDGELVSGHKPSVDVLFSSAAKYTSDNAIGIILTGMGRDGAKGLLEMKNAGCTTIGQDEKSCVVYGMPKVAYEIGAVNYVVSLDNLAEKVISILNQ